MKASNPSDEPAKIPVRSLTNTVVLATLEDPVPAGKNAVWCASFQLAWDRLQRDVTRGPARVKGAEKLCDRLNSGRFAPSDLEEPDYYAAAGWLKDGILERIRGEMGRKFPGIEPPSAQGGEVAVAYAFLHAGLRFAIPYFENREPLNFNGYQASSFGIREEDDYAYAKMRAQVGPLYWTDHGGSMKEFAVDLDRSSQPLQVVIAMVDLKESIARTLEDLESKFKTMGNFGRRFGPNEVLLVPNVRFDITHRFAELEGKDRPLESTSGLYVGLALERIQFLLDRGGAEVKSEAKVYVKPIPRYFICDRPFLVYMRKRPAGRPFFAAWVSTPELLEPFR